MITQNSLDDWYKAFDPLRYDYRWKFQAFEIFYRIFAHLEGREDLEYIVYEIARPASFAVATMNDDDLKEFLNKAYKSSSPFYWDLFDPKDFDLEMFKELQKMYPLEMCEVNVILLYGKARFIVSEGDYDLMTDENLDCLKDIAQKKDEPSSGLNNPIYVKRDKDGSLLID